MQKISSTALLLLALSAISIQSAAAQSQDQRNADIEQLKNKLQQLDQMMTEVKGEIKSLEGTPAPLVGQGQAEGQKTSAPQEPMIAVPSEAIIAQPQAGTVPLEGEITERQNSVSFYGFTMLDSGYDFGQINPNWY